ncbi:MAG: response regulator transcription factor [Actinobacteria bacterium]|nr:response regulator transcription factor [Actinomycetota bacterium]
MTDEAGDRPIRLLICDDHRILTDALAMVVSRDPGFELLEPPTADPEEAVAQAARHQPDVVLMDIEFRGAMNGIEASRRIKEASPSTRVVIMTAHEDERLLVAAVEAGASAFLPKTEAVDQLLSAVRSAAEGEVLIDPAALTRLLAEVAREREARRDADLLLRQLTERELEVLSLLAQGRRNEEIAGKLFISPQTVQTHVRNILSKLGVHSKLEAVVFAVRNGAVEV